MKPFIALLSTSLFLCACQQDDAPKVASSTAQASEPVAMMTYQVLTEKAYPPFIVHSGVDNVQGFEYDLLTEIGKRQGFRLTFKPHTWNGLLNTLNTGEADIVSSGITITNERKKFMSFSDPYFETETVLLIGKDSKNIKKFADMQGNKIATKKGTLQDDMVQSHHRTPVYADTSWLSVKSTIAKDSDATLGDLGVLTYFMNEYASEGLQVVKDASSPKEQLGFGIRKDNIALQTQLNQGLQQLKSDGTYQKLYQKWFGSHVVP